MGFFSEMEFGFQEGVGCTEASFIITETINHKLEHDSKNFSCFLNVRKAFETVWIDGLLYKHFLQLEIKGRMWLAIRDLAPFMYKMYANGLLTVLSNHCYAILIDGFAVPSPSFADDISLLMLHPYFLKILFLSLSCLES